MKNKIEYEYINWLQMEIIHRELAPGYSCPFFRTGDNAGLFLVKRGLKQVWAALDFFADVVPNRQGPEGFWLTVEQAEALVGGKSWEQIF